MAGVPTRPETVTGRICPGTAVGRTHSGTAVLIHRATAVRRGILTQVTMGPPPTRIQALTAELRLADTGDTAHSMAF